MVVDGGGKYWREQQNLLRYLDGSEPRLNKEYEHVRKENTKLEPKLEPNLLSSYIRQSKHSLPIPCELMGFIRFHATGTETSSQTDILLPLDRSIDEQTIHNLLKLTKQATFETVPERFGMSSGDSGRKTINLNVRNSREIEGYCTEALDKNHHPVDWNKVCKTQWIKWHINKLHIYGPGGHFQSHRDTIQTTGHVLNAVVELPTRRSNGNLQIYNPIKQAWEDQTHPSDNLIQVVIFPPQTYHRASAVTEGYRVILQLIGIATEYSD